MEPGVHKVGKEASSSSTSVEFFARDLPPPTLPLKSRSTSLSALDTCLASFSNSLSSSCFLGHTEHYAAGVHTGLP